MAKLKGSPVSAQRPTHVIDIYKMRRGRYKNVRIWIQLDLGTGERKDLCVTTSDNELLSDIKNNILSVNEERSLYNWRGELLGE